MYVFVYVYMCVHIYTYQGCIPLFHVMLFISFTVHIMHRLSYTSLLANVSCFTYDMK